MKKKLFLKRLKDLNQKHQQLLARKNKQRKSGNGIFDRYKYPVLTAKHPPLFWRYDLNPASNPYLLERLGINATFNPGAVELDGKIYLAVRVEGNDRKSFFAIAGSKSGIDRFRFWDYPILMPETEVPDINVYDMRLV